MSAYLLIKRKDGQDINLKDKDFNFPRENGLFVLDEIGYHKHKKKQIKCTFTGKIPSEIISIIDIPNKLERGAKALPYIQNLIKDHLQRDDDLDISFVDYKKRNPKKGSKCVFSTFKRNLQQASQAGIENKNHFFLLAGDAYRAPNYEIGHGANDALFHAGLFGLFLSNKKKRADIWRSSAFFMQKINITNDDVEDQNNTPSINK